MGENNVDLKFSFASSGFNIMRYFSKHRVVVGVAVVGVYFLFILSTLQLSSDWFKNFRKFVSPPPLLGWAMDSRWKSSFGRSRTPMGTVPISVIYGYKYPLREWEGELCQTFQLFRLKLKLLFEYLMSRIKVSPPTPSPIPDPKTSQVSSSCLTTTSRSVWPSSLNSYKPPEIVRTPGW